MTGPENRTIFFGMDVGSTGAEALRRQGQEPLRRQAGAPGHEHGHQSRSDPARRHARPVGAGRRDHAAVRQRLHQGARRASRRVDVAKAKALLAEAGYPNGFCVTLHCPNDRYLNDEAICQAAVGMLGQIGVKVNLVSQSKSLHFPLIQKTPRPTSTCSAGACRPTTHEYIFSFLYHTRDRQVRQLERHALLQRRGRQADPVPVERDRHRQAQRDIAKIWAVQGRTRSTSRSTIRCWPTR